MQVATSLPRRTSIAARIFRMAGLMRAGPGSGLALAALLFAGPLLEHVLFNPGHIRPL